MKALLVGIFTPISEKYSVKLTDNEEFDFWIMNKTTASNGSCLTRVKACNKSLLLLINLSLVSFNLSSLNNSISKQPLPAFVVAVSLPLSY